ncbi:CoA-acylating methylmalonate-semialdehyde dehydrogenase [Micromonospora craniellae]|uniref:methylmalonate-semialdehyde dehydrogenase (CoA acylating) n=1 Tax=Micromonospora craniellae TaxID=2294034 RepID=A0A372FUA6_9ACTN|nr:CoA-acylating methylmalonate-semialdehyde dehydrogenase [Micromonospora craniellae]QOC92340.1 CoA-acylating methylmalonate-semialdehyde dehydrogenase [Micromonospora craniellae]RFS44110.1 methylmalonate-semialdehyde dehydrogenase (CoA acylating) [Micromonospora craniellae]
MEQLTHFIAGRHVAGGSGRFGDVYDPSTGHVARQVPMASADEVHAALADAAAAQRGWAATNPQRRARVLIRWLALIHQQADELAALLSAEHGKTVADAHGDIQRGTEVVEFAIGVPHLLKGEYTDSAGAGIDVYSMRQPLGVVAGITPFNFPAMIPLWQAAPALACGNAFVLKPSERTPSVPLRLAELFVAAGGPPGVFNVVNGDSEAAAPLLTDPRVQAVGFVGSSTAARHVYATATAHGKRAQCFGGAKNHAVVMPDADLDQVVDALVGAAFGSAGERCMAVSVAVPVGERTADALVARLTDRIRGLRVGAANDPDADFGPLVTDVARQRVTDHIAAGVSEHATLLLDGRGRTVDTHPDGFYLGPSLFDRVTPQMSIYQEEIFGPVLCVVRAADYESAVRLCDEHPYGNGVSVFTRDGDTARDFAQRVQVGMVGVNVPIPVPIAYHTFGGWKASGFGDLNQHGPDSIRFHTRTKTVTSRWLSRGVRDGASFVIPTMS